MDKGRHWTSTSPAWNALTGRFTYSLWQAWMSRQTPCPPTTVSVGTLVSPLSTTILVAYAMQSLHACCSNPIAMKVFNRITSHLKITTDPLLVVMQFSYQSYRSVDDSKPRTALHPHLHCIWTSRDHTHIYIFLYFLNFTLTLNAVVPELLHTILSQMIVPKVSLYVVHQLPERRQCLRLEKQTSLP